MIMMDNSCHFCTKTYVVTPHLNRLGETVQMRGHNIWFQAEKRKFIIIPQLSSNTPFYLELCMRNDKELLSHYRDAFTTNDKNHKSCRSLLSPLSDSNCKKLSGV